MSLALILLLQADSARPLFNGRDLEGWTSVGSARWRVEEGVLVGGQEGDPKRSGVLHTASTFRDFELFLDFMIDEHGKYNSGVYLRQKAGTGRRSGWQVNLGRGEAGEYCAGLFLREWLGKGDAQDRIRRRLDWNSLRILCVGGRVEVDLNGVRVVDYVDPAPAAELVEPGVIALQTYGAEGHAGWVKFRSVRIREIR